MYKKIELEDICNKTTLTKCPIGRKQNLAKLGLSYLIYGL